MTRDADSPANLVDGNNNGNGEKKKECSVESSSAVPPMPAKQRDSKFQGLLRQSIALMIRRPLTTSLTYTTTGLCGWMVVRSSLDGFYLLRAALFLESFVLLGPLGMVRGCIAATREIVVDSGLAAHVGRVIFDNALKVLDCDDTNDVAQLKDAKGENDMSTSTTNHVKPKNLKEAIQEIRESYPWANALLELTTGDGGYTGYFVETCLGFFLPDIGTIFDKIEEAIEWSEAEENKDIVEADRDIVGRATENYVGEYMAQKDEMVQTFGTFFVGTITGVCFAVGVLFRPFMVGRSASTS